MRLGEEAMVLRDGINTYTICKQVVLLYMHACFIHLLSVQEYPRFQSLYTFPSKQDIVSTGPHLTIPVDKFPFTTTCAVNVV